MPSNRKLTHLKWDRGLTVYLEKIDFCERCKKWLPVGQRDKAHRVKRRFIGWRTEDDRLEYFTAAILCRKCHAALDEAKTPEAHEIMFKVITEIVIKRRDILLTGIRLLPPFVEWDPVRIYNYAR